MRVYKCYHVKVTYEYGGPRLSVIMIDDHAERGGKSGERTITSLIKLVDFERKYAITQNSIYDWS